LFQKANGVCAIRSLEKKVTRNVHACKDRGAKAVAAILLNGKREREPRNSASQKRHGSNLVLARQHRVGYVLEDSRKAMRETKHRRDLARYIQHGSTLAMQQFSSGKDHGDVKVAEDNYDYALFCFLELLYYGQSTQIGS